MEHEVTTALTIIKSITVLLGLAFLYYTGRAWLRHKSRGMLVLFAAIGLMTLAAVAEGFAFAILGEDLDTAHLVEAAIMLLAFAVLVASVWAHRLDRA